VEVSATNPPSLLFFPVPVFSRRSRHLWASNGSCLPRVPSTGPVVRVVQFHHSQRRLGGLPVQLLFGVSTAPFSSTPRRFQSSAVAACAERMNGRDVARASGLIRTTQGSYANETHISSPTAIFEYGFPNGARHERKCLDRLNGQPVLYGWKLGAQEWRKTISPSGDLMETETRGYTPSVLLSSEWETLGPYSLLGVNSALLTSEDGDEGDGYVSNGLHFQRGEPSTTTDDPGGS